MMFAATLVNAGILSVVAGALKKENMCQV